MCRGKQGPILCAKSVCGIEEGMATHRVQHNEWTNAKEWPRFGCATQRMDKCSYKFVELDCCPLCFSQVNFKEIFFFFKYFP